MGAPIPKVHSHHTKNKRGIYVIQTTSKKGLLYSLNVQLYYQDFHVSVFTVLIHDISFLVTHVQSIQLECSAVIFLHALTKKLTE